MKIDIDKLMETIEEDLNYGFCLACGFQQSNCEPDARNYVCEDCREPAVFGAEEILIMGAYDD